MMCWPHYSWLSSTSDNIVTPDSASTILFNVVDKCEQRWAGGIKTLFSAVIFRVQSFYDVLRHICSHCRECIFKLETKFKVLVIVQFLSLTEQLTEN